MNETELEAMVVRLLGDGSSYAQMMTQAAESTKETAAIIKTQADQIEGFKNSITGFASTAVSALAALGAGDFLRRSMNMYAETETATIKLSSAIRGNGGDVERTLAAYKAFASELKKTTGASGDETLALLKQAEAFGLSGKAAMNAVETSHRLAAAADIDASQAMRVAVALEQGDIRRAMSMARVIPQLRRIRDESEFMVAVNRLVNQGQIQQIALMNSTEGVFKRFYASLKAITKQFGQYVAEAVVPVVKWTTELIERYGKLDDGTKRLVVAAAFLVTGLLSILPAIGTIGAILTPIIGLFSGGFAIIASVVGLILSPILILKGILIGLGVVVATVFSPIGVAIVAVTLAIVGLVRRAGGLQGTWNSIKVWALEAWEKIKVYALATWEWIKEKALAFYEWIGPIADATASLLVTAWGIVWNFISAVWEGIKSAATAAWNWVKGVFQGMFGDAELNWTSIRDFIQEAILFVEFTLLNFRQVSDTVWLAIQLQVVRAVNYILGQINRMSDRINQVFSELNIRIRLSQLDLESGLENDLRARFQDAQNSLNRDFQAFVAMRRAQFARNNTRPEEAAAQEAGERIGSSFNHGIEKEAHKFDAVLINTAEDFRRLTAYYERLTAQPTGRTSALSSTSPVAGASPSQPVPVQAVAPAQQDPSQGIIIELLRFIRTATETVAQRPPVTVVGVSLS